MLCLEIWTFEVVTLINRLLPKSLFQIWGVTACLNYFSVQCTEPASPCHFPGLTSPCGSRCRLIWWRRRNSAFVPEQGICWFEIWSELRCNACQSEIWKCNSDDFYSMHKKQKEQKKKQNNKDNDKRKKNIGRIMKTKKNQKTMMRTRIKLNKHDKKHNKRVVVTAMTDHKPLKQTQPTTV